jgi:chromosomal replication initiation ATPase DnaA
MIKENDFNRNVDLISHKVGLPKRELFIKSRRQDIVDARQLLFWKCFKDGITISYIQRYLSRNGLDLEHSTIIYGINKVKELMKDKDFSSFVKDLNHV